MFDRMSIREGMTVRSSDGEKLGKVFAIGDHEFMVEKGVFFPHDYLVRYADVVDVRAHELILRHGREELHRQSEDLADRGFSPGRTRDAASLSDEPGIADEPRP